MGGIVDAVKSVVTPIVNTVGDTAKAVLGDTIGGGVKNILSGVSNAAFTTMHGAVTGNWTQFRDGALANITTAIAALAIVSGSVIGIAVGVTILDAQYNKGNWLHQSVQAVGGVESAVFGTHYIDTYSMYIEMAAQIAASVAAPMSAYSVIKDAGYFTQFTDLVDKYKSALDAIGGIYNIYDAYTQYVNTKEYYEALINALANQMAAAMTQASALSEQWFSLFTDYDTIGRIMPGGDIFNGGAGSDFYSCTDVNEPARYLLSMATCADSDIDDRVFNRMEDLMSGGDSYFYTIDGGIKWPAI